MLMLNAVSFKPHAEDSGRGQSEIVELDPEERAWKWGRQDPQV